MNCARYLFAWVIVVMLFAWLTPTVHSQSNKKESGIDSTVSFCKETILNNCSGCHGAKGQGDAGPNLTDQYWLHGGGTKNISHTIANGVAGKGMIGWKAVYSEKDIQRITSCVLALQGTNPAKAKKPEGELYEN